MGVGGAHLGVGPVQLELDLLGQLGGHYLVLGLGLGNEQLGLGPAQLEPGLLWQLREHYLGLGLVLGGEYLGLGLVQLESGLLGQREGVISVTAWALAVIILVYGESGTGDYWLVTQVVAP